MEFLIIFLSYFFGFIDAGESQRLLKVEPLGTFLIRFSSQAKMYSLSVATGNGSVAHWRISVAEDGNTVNYDIDKRKFSSLNDLISKFSKETLKSPQGNVSLKVPLERSKYKEIYVKEGYIVPEV